MASYESQTGWLDFGSGRYKLIGRPGRDDSSLHVGEWVAVCNGMPWVAIQVLADRWGQWYFLDGDGERVSIEVGMPARLVE
jgi:hypothetical protein